jgi:GntR family transcriptional regulator/MocR family aminotransferase
MIPPAAPCLKGHLAKELLVHAVQVTVKTLFEVELQTTAKGSREAGHSLHRQLKAAIGDGRLPLGSRLPPTRDAQSAFRVSRNTAAEVYDRLINEGYVVARRGSGTFVADTLPLTPARVASGGDVAGRLNPFWLRPDVASAMGFWRDAAPQTSRNSRSVDLRPALVDSRLFPFALFRRLMAKQLRLLERKPASFKSPQGNRGNFALREAITRHIALTRAVVCATDDVLVTSGAQQAFDLLARTLIVPGETVVAVEDPGYPPMRVAFAAAGAKLVPVPVDEQGLLIERIPDNAGVVCLCPSHQFPTGVTMSAPRRKALVAWARQHAAVIVEDDYDGEFRYEENPLAALRTPDSADVVFYVGTFSKCMLPALRLGFLVAPEWAMPTLVAAKNAMDWHCPIPLQLAVAAFIAEGHLAQHVRKMRQVYQQRRRLLLDNLHTDFAPWLTPIASSYGMHVGAHAGAGADLERAVADLARQHVMLHTFGRYYLGRPGQSGIVLGYGTAGVPELKHGLTLLRKALHAAA